MSDWFTKNLGDAMLVSEALGQINGSFRAAHKNSNGPKEMAVFIRYESEGRLHCEVKAYFSPASIAVAKAVDAEPCKKPTPDGLSLLIGAEDLWSTLFPDRSG
jgi:hypothetical protein